MKQLIYSLIIIIIIVSLGIYTIKTVEGEAESLHTLMVELEDNIFNNEWESAKSIAETTQKQWDKYKKVWPMLIDHFEIDNMNTKLAELHAYIISRNKTETLSKIAALKVLIKHIPERESFIIQNIL
jgi:hypothetical protein